MKDIEELKKKYEEEIEIAKKCNEIEKEIGVEPVGFEFMGAYHYSLKVKDDATAGKILYSYLATETKQTHKKRNMFHLCQIVNSAIGEGPYLSIKWKHKDMEFEIQVLNFTTSVIFGRLCGRYGSRVVTPAEAELTVGQTNGRALYNRKITSYAFNGENTFFQGGYILCEEPTVSDAIVQAFIDEYCKK